MPAMTNTQMAADTVAALSEEFVENFSGEFDRLNEILGLFPAEVATAGSALYQYVITGELNDATVAEGEDTPLTKYKLDKEYIGEVDFKPYRKRTTAKAIQKGGFENAVIRTDKRMQSQARAAVLNDFFVFLQKGTGATTAVSLQDALAQVDATIGNACEDNADEAGDIIHFVNRSDAADYLGKAQITTQTAFGWDYVESFLGVKHVVFTNKIPAGVVWATPIENIRVRGVDWGALDEAGLVYTVDELGIIAVHHAPDYKSNSCETYVNVGLNLLPEVKDYICKATFGDAKADEPVEDDEKPVEDDENSETGSEG